MAKVSPRYPHATTDSKKTQKAAAPDTPTHARVFAFTNTAVDAVPLPESGRVEYRDEGNRALILRVASSGAKAFCVGRKIKGKFCRVTLGTFKGAGGTQVRMTVEMARKALRAAEGDLVKNVAVNAEKRAARTAGDTLGRWLAAYLKANKELKPRTRSDYASVLNEFCDDWIDKPLADITREKLKARHERHGAERSEARANNAVRVLRALFNYAGIDPNPASSPKRKQAGKAGSFLFKAVRKKTLIDDGDMPAWWAAVSNLRAMRVDSAASDASDLLRTLVLTGLRAGEACGLEWRNVNVRDGIITITDTKNDDAHVLPLGTMLHDIIRKRSEGAKGRYVFATKGNPNEPFNYSTLRGWFATVTAECGVSITAHDCRRTFATTADSLDMSSITIKRLLNHRTGRGDVTEGYINPTPERLRAAMQRIEDKVLSLAKWEPGA